MFKVTFLSFVTFVTKTNIEVINRLRMSLYWSQVNDRCTLFPCTQNSRPVCSFNECLNSTTSMLNLLAVITSNRVTNTIRASRLPENSKSITKKNSSQGILLSKWTLFFYSMMECMSFVNIQIREVKWNIVKTIDCYRKDCRLGLNLAQDRVIARWNTECYNACHE